jgi:hypothetical protein
VVREDLFEEQRPEQMTGRGRHVDVYKKGVPGRGSSRYKGSEIGPPGLEVQ